MYMMTHKIKSSICIVRGHLIIIFESLCKAINIGIGIDKKASNNAQVNMLTPACRISNLREK